MTVITYRFASNNAYFGVKQYLNVLDEPFLNVKKKKRKQTRQALKLQIARSTSSTKWTRSWRWATPAPSSPRP